MSVHGWLKGSGRPRFQERVDFIYLPISTIAYNWSAEFPSILATGTKLGLSKSKREREIGQKGLLD